MGRLVILMVFYWLMLIENGTDWLGVIFDIGNGLEIRFSLLIKVLMLFINLIIIFTINKKITILKHIFIFSVFLLCSTFYILWLNPKYFIGALSANLHIQLVLNVILFIYLNSNTEIQIQKFYNGLRLFGLINAILVIISYIIPDLTGFFEAGIANSGVRRAFGIMGDEVSMFMTFFLYDALIFKKYYNFGFFFIAILFTGGIGAFFTSVILIFYYIFFVMKVGRKQLSFLSLFAFLTIITGFLVIGQLKEISVVKRIVNNFANPKEETGSLRLLSLTTAYDMVVEKPLLGYGYGAYGPSVYEKYEPIYKKLGKGWNFSNIRVILGSSFNPYIQMICETGVIGLFFFISLLLSFLSYCKKDLNTINDFINQFRKVSHGWLLIFFLSCISANWLLPASFLFLLVVTLVGLNLRLNSLYLVNSESKL